MVGKPLDCCWAFNPTLNELINLAINGELQQTVNARELHSFLESKQDFSTWIKNRIEQYDFVENQDFVRFPKKWKTLKVVVQPLNTTSRLLGLSPWLFVFKDQQ